MEKPRQKQITLSSGRRISYFDFGDPKGFPILLHSGHISSGILAVFIDELAQKNRFRVVSVNRPGIGESDYYDYDLTSVANDSRELMKLLKLEKYIVVSLSAGSAFLFALCQENPNVVLGVALSPFGPYQKIKQKSVGLERLYFGPANETLPKLFLSFFRIAPGIVDFVANFFLDGLPQMEQKEKMKVIFAWDRGLALGNGMEPMLRERKLLISSWENLVASSNQKIKYLFFHGETDRSAPMSVLGWYSQSLAKTSVTIYKKENHFAPLNHLQEIFSAMRQEIDMKG